MNESPADRLKSERKLLKLTQQEAAAACGVVRETWSRYESGDLAPGLEVLAAFARRGADVRWIVTGLSDMPVRDPLTGEEQVLLGHWRSASRPVRNAALAVLLSDSLNPRSAAIQTFHGPVGNVTEGSQSMRDVVVHQNIGQYPRATAKRPKKPPGKP